MHGHMPRCTVTCHDAQSHVTMHGHMSRCTVTCHDARSHVTMHGHMNVKDKKTCCCSYTALYRVHVHPTCVQALEREQINTYSCPYSHEMSSLQRIATASYQPFALCSVLTKVKTSAPVCRRSFSSRYEKGKLLLQCESEWDFYI